MTIWVAEYEYGRYNMRGYGASKEEALGALIRCARAHIAQTGANDYTSDILDIEPQEVTLGVGYRDGEPCGQHAAAA